MLAINWFEVSLSSVSGEVPVEYVDDTTRAPERRRSIAHRTLLKKADEGHVVYHITATPPRGVGTEEVDFERQPSVAKYAIEQGFAARLEACGFSARLRHVGGVGYRPAGNTLLPDIYDVTEGIEFRCFYGFNRDEPTRWGLILNYTTGQRFNVSLADLHLQELAFGERVVPRDRRSRGTSSRRQVAGQTLRSGVLRSVSDDEALIVDEEGTEHGVPLEQWTLQPNRHNLLRYVRSAKGEKVASRVSTELQRRSLTLTSTGRMNTALAKDQLQKLQTLLAEYDLTTFSLPLPDQVLARVNEEPMIVGQA